MSSAATEAVIALGQLSLAFGRINRITRHEDGIRPESDTDHTVALGLIGCAFAAAHLPHLDLGLIAQLALVHDLCEVHAGDTPTLRITAAGREKKRRREHEAYLRISDQFSATLPWVPERIVEYEALSTPEARYLKALDKLLPKITHFLNGAATIREQGMGRDELVLRYADQLNELRGYASDFPALFELRTELVALVLGCVPGQAEKTRG